MLQNDNNGKTISNAEKELNGMAQKQWRPVILSRMFCDYGVAALKYTIDQNYDQTIQCSNSICVRRMPFQLKKQRYRDECARKRVKVDGK